MHYVLCICIETVELTHAAMQFDASTSWEYNRHWHMYHRDLYTVTHSDTDRHPVTQGTANCIEFRGVLICGLINLINDWLNKCTEYEAVGPRPKGRPKKTWREAVEKDCQVRKLNKEDAMDHSRWRKLLKDVWWTEWCEWVNVSSSTGAHR